MYLYSKWLITDLGPEGSATFAKMWGKDIDDSMSRNVTQGDGSVTRRMVEYTTSSDSEWNATPNSVGQWIVGVANMPAQDAVGSRLVGIITPSASLTDHLAGDLSDQIKSMRLSCEPVRFLLSTLLDLREETSGAQVSSVRLNSDEARVLVQSNNQQTLRDIISGIQGDTEGITMRTEDGKVTVNDQGTAVFSESTSAAQILELMNTIVEAHAIPIAATSVAWA